MSTRNFKKKHPKSTTTGTRDAVETAIDLSKDTGRHTWESLARRVRGRFPTWATEVRQKNESKMEGSTWSWPRERQKIE